ncbi:uncharacterized protein METZ01_LOCUS215788 [marine metagenome]|uniref:Uncharacterized protein n=1 Tax=marine metagenome TaxID=408172 RepID=A0A382FKQ1_9ZZZZ
MVEIFLRKIFANHPDPFALFPYRLREHCTADGYREVTKTIIEKIKD